ncbi:hypothetical protein PRZ48_012904 [Zasmidium cellare]|uniref:Uncharacterized protein n=1 Tax=Zasmidium cellare TaxID=395010 RepID=A0ABR0E334_ZASCE|nr:hypothetical protein PRZ48_012904 [Zasmidium cellare]
MEIDEEPHSPDSDEYDSSDTDYDEPPPPTRVQLALRAFSMLSTVIYSIGAQSTGRLDSYINECQYTWNDWAQDRIPPYNGSDQMQTFVYSDMRYLEDWQLEAKVRVEPNKNWGKDLTVSENVDRDRSDNEFPTGSAERFCREINRGLRSLHLEIGRECWGWGRPVLLRLRGVQIITVRLEQTMLLGHLRAAGEWYDYVASVVETIPPGLVGHERSIAAWKAQWESPDAFVSWWSQEERKSEKEGIKRFGEVLCPLASKHEAICAYDEEEDKEEEEEQEDKEEDKNEDTGFRNPESRKDSQLWLLQEAA